MKNSLLGFFLIALLVMAQTAAADDRRYRRGYAGHGWQSPYDFGYQRYNRRHYGSGYRRAYGNYYPRQYNPYHYGYRDRRGGAFINFSYGNYYPRYYSRHRSRHRHYDSGAFLGGLVLGSLLTYPSYSKRSYEPVSYRSYPPVRSREVVVVQEPASRRVAPATGGRRLLRDLDGNCFEVSVDGAGNELRVQLDPAQCDY